MSNHYTIDFTVTRSKTLSITVEAKSPTDAMRSIREDAATYGTLADIAGCVDVMFHACEQRKEVMP